MNVDAERVRKLNSIPDKKGIIIYWMSRDQRVDNNWALLFATELAAEKKAPLVVVFTLDPSFPEANLRHFDFMIKGLMEVEAKLRQLNITFVLLSGDPVDQLRKFLVKNTAGSIVADFDPLKVKRKWKQALLSQLETSFYEVDAHNVVPCWIASQKEEFTAYTFRPRINRLLPRYLSSFQQMEEQKDNPFSGIKTDWKTIFQSLGSNDPVPPVNWIVPGSEAAGNMLHHFIEYKLDDYVSNRNDPTKDALSNLSPYLHFGQFSAQKVAIAVLKSGMKEESVNAFLEELIVRRELADNFCYYNINYDNTQGFKEWARKTLNQHRDDKRRFVYTISQFEKGETHDPLWNAAQLEMKIKGKMQGYMRMYWAKKILEWASSPEEALMTAIYLNDKYELDGRDPNGYAGCAWSIGGVHDRAWIDREVFGKIRYMNFNGCKRKFDVDSYITHVNQMQVNKGN